MTVCASIRAYPLRLGGNEVSSLTEPSNICFSANIIPPEISSNELINALVVGSTYP